MEVAKIYIVKGSHGRYEDFYSYDVRALFHKDQAERFAEHLDSFRTSKQWDKLRLLDKRVDPSDQHSYEVQEVELGIWPA